MKSFQYKAKNELGEVIEGVLETDDFGEASKVIQSRGLELVSLEELRAQIQKAVIEDIREEKQKLRSFTFHALDQDSEDIEGTIQGVDEEGVQKTLADEFGYQQIKISEQEEEREIIDVQRSNEDQEEEMRAESIIFSESKEPVVEKKTAIPESDLLATHRDIEKLLDDHDDLLSQRIKDKLKQLDSMLDLVREDQSSKHWKKLKKEIRRTLKKAEREVEQHHNRKWSAFEKLEGEDTIEGFDEMQQEPAKKIFNPDSKLSRLTNWLELIDDPNLENEEEVLTKQKYESIITEIQRFSGALFAFYIACYFVAYYLARNGLTDHFLVRIYDAVLFKQIVLVLFSVFCLLTIRNYFLPKRVKSDGVLALLLIGVSMWVLG